MSGLGVVISVVLQSTAGTFMFMMAAFGGGAVDQLWGAQATNVLQKFTEKFDVSHQHILQLMGPFAEAENRIVEPPQPNL